MTEDITLSNRYRLEERLGSGGMSIVYRAHDLMLERTVAIKLLRKNYSNNPQFRQQFKQEAKAVANLSHPNIVTIYDFGLDSNQLFIIMEYVPGKDLKSLLREKGMIDIDTSIDLMVQACDGIGYAHRAGLVHCDIKPQNMLVTPDFRLKVVDFGIARALAGISPHEKSDIVWGSPHYFSPEQAAGNAPSPASDVYSLGVVLFEMITGQLPFKGETPEQLADQHRLTLPPSPRKINPQIQPALEEILLKVLSKEPSARYRTADQFGSVLRTFIAPSYYSLDEVSSQAEEPFSTANLEEIQNKSWQTNYNHEYASAAPHQPSRPVLTVIEKDQERAQEFDWITWVLALLALLAAGGLIPFLLWVLYILKPPI